MSNIYGFDGIVPEWARYGVYDLDNGEWTGTFCADITGAQAEANRLRGENFNVVATDDEDVTVDPEPLIVALDYALTRKQITRGNTASGEYVLAVDPKDGDHRIVWCGNTRAWNPWPDGWRTISLPALFPDGSGKEQDEAKACLEEAGIYEEAQRLREKLDLAYVTLCEKLIPDAWEEYRGSLLDSPTDQFLSACNGEGDAPWGYVTDKNGDVSVIDPPAVFIWAKGEGEDK